MKESRDLLVGEPLVETQLDDLAVGSRQKIDHFPEQNKQFPFLGKSLRIEGRSSPLLERVLTATDLLSVVILGRIGDDRMDPRASFGAVEAGIVDGLEDLDPTGLKNILCEAVVAGDPLGEGQEAAGATGNPGFGVGFEQRTVFGGSLELRSGQNVESARHPVRSRFQ
jgi:hypothetical protein